jgi:uncharacterized protein YndB with AHSA1/START domain
MAAAVALPALSGLRGKMFNLLKSLLALVVVLCVLAGFYGVFLQTFVLTWGATPAEVAASMPGDELAPYASSTRAITINAPRNEVWKCLAQLGADRAGFYGYSFLEELMGFHGRENREILPEHLELRVGRVIPSSMDESDSGPNWAFRVKAVDRPNSVVLEEWGAFVLKDLGGGRTRLILRTHGWELPDIWHRAGYFLFMPMHYIMERKMMMGIRDTAEAGGKEQESSTGDMIWVASLFLSLVGIVVMVFVGRGAKRIWVPCVLGMLWLLVLLWFSPEAVYGAGLVVVVTGAMVSVIASRATRRRDTLR